MTTTRTHEGSMRVVEAAVAVVGRAMNTGTRATRLEAVEVLAAAVEVLRQDVAAARR